jgi:hypothetical protein
MSGQTRIADRLYAPSTPKPAGPRIVDGWMEVPGGGWIKCGAHTCQGVTWTIGGRDVKAAPSSAADKFYGNRG